MVHDARRSVLVFFAASVGLHVLAAFAVWSVPRLPTLRADTLDVDVWMDENVGLGEPPGVRRHGASPVRPGGRAMAQNVDAPNAGERGDGWSEGPILLLMSRAEGVTLSDTPPTSLHRSQLARIRTASDRGTQEDRRATPHPADEAFLATGTGSYRHRRRPSERAPALGAPRSDPASTRGATATERPGDELSAADSEITRARGRGDAPPHSPGVAERSPGRGQLDGSGSGRRGADLALGRPPVDRGPAATESEQRSIHVRDDRDAEQLAASFVQSLVDSTAHGGARHGPGIGGVGGGGAAGSGGGRGEGGRARAPGRGGVGGSYREDARYLRWYLNQRRRVDRGLIFPQARQLAMDQGTSVFRVVVRRDGSLRSSPSLVRSSGYPDLDEAARRAILRAQPFAPLPADLVPDRDQLAVRLAIDFQNPMVH